MDREKLLNEIFELEPELRTKENEVRSLVFAMLENKPAIIPDMAMKALVRARLLAQFESGKTGLVKSPWFEWVWYTAPIGVALLLFMLVTPPFGMEGVVEAPTMGTFKSAPAADTAPAGGVGASNLKQAPLETAVSDGEEQGSSLRSMEAADGLTEMETAPVIGRNAGMLVGKQTAGYFVRLDKLTLVNAGTVKIKVIADGSVLGQSAWLEAGDYTNQTILLDTPLESGAVYEVAIYEGENLVFATFFEVLK